MSEIVDEADAELGAAVAGARRLAEILSETQADIGRMPIFVRPMAKRGYSKRTGMSFSEWERFSRDLLQRLLGGRPRARTVRADTIQYLEKLSENYRTAPQRAAKFMRDPATLATIRERTEARRRSVQELVAALRALGVG